MADGVLSPVPNSSCKSSVRIIAGCAAAYLVSSSTGASANAWLVTAPDSKCRHVVSSEDRGRQIAYVKGTFPLLTRSKAFYNKESCVTEEKNMTESSSTERTRNSRW